MRQDSSITEIKGIGEKTKKLFEKMGQNATTLLNSATITAQANVRLEGLQ